MSDWSAIGSTLRSNASVLFIEPSRELYTQGDLHQHGEDLRRERGLGDSIPYLGWHWQAHAFTRSGALQGVQRVYFGGDRTAVGEALHRLEGQGYVVGGGQTHDQSFAIMSDTELGTASEPDVAAWRTRLAALVSEYAPPVREGEESLLHEGLRTETLRALWPEIVRALQMRGCLTEGDMGHALAPSVVDALVQNSDDASESIAVLVAALEAGYAPSQEIVEERARRGTATMPELIAWARLQPAHALDAARQRVFTTGQRVSDYVKLVRDSGGDPLEAAVEVAERHRSLDAEGAPTTDRALMNEIVGCFGGWSREYAARAIRDERIPVWLRAAIATSWSGTPLTPENNQVHRDRGQGVPDAVAREWPALVDDVRAEAALPPHPGFDVESSLAQQVALEVREYMLRHHTEGLRGALRRDDLSEPAAAVLLELLYPAGALTEDDVDELLTSWKTRWFVKPGTYTPAPPAVLTLAVAAEQLRHRQAEAVVAAIMKSKRAWVMPLKHALMAARVQGDAADADAEAQLAPCALQSSNYSESAAFALVAVRARRRGTPQVRAASDLILESPETPGYIARGFAMAAISSADAGSHLGHTRINKRSPRAFRAALSIAEEDTLPVRTRLSVLKIAAESRMLQDPEQLIVSVSVEEHEQLVQRLSRLVESLEAP